MRSKTSAPAARATSAVRSVQLSAIDQDAEAAPVVRHAARQLATVAAMLCFLVVGRDDDQEAGRRRLPGILTPGGGVAGRSASTPTTRPR